MTLLGHSWGAMLILEWVKKYGDKKIDNFILIATGVDHTVEDDYRRGLNNNPPSKIDVSWLSPENDDDEFKKACIENAALFYGKNSIDQGIEILKNIKYSASSVLFKACLANCPIAKSAEVYSSIIDAKVCPSLKYSVKCGLIS